MEFNLWSLIHWATFFLLGSGFITTIFTQRQIADREIESRQFESKRKTYQEFIDFLNHDVCAKQMGLKTLSEAKRNQKMVDFRKSLTLWGDSRTIMSFEYFVSLNKHPHEEIEVFLRCDLLLRSLRSELGHDDSNLPLGTLALIQLKPDTKKDEMFEVLQQKSRTSEHKKTIKTLTKKRSWLGGRR